MAMWTQLIKWLEVRKAAEAEWAADEKWLLEGFKVWASPEYQQGRYDNHTDSFVFLRDKEAWDQHVSDIRQSHVTYYDEPDDGDFPILVKERTGDGWCGTIKAVLTVVEKNVDVPFFAEDRAQFQSVELVTI